MKLSPSMLKLLGRLVVAKDGWETRPETGGRDAGRRASAWQRTVNALAHRGMVTAHSHGARITDAGRNEAEKNQ